MSAVDISVRRMDAADTTALNTLETAARAALVDQRGGAAHLAERPAVGEWATLLGDDEHPVWVAVLHTAPGDVVVGYLEVRMHQIGRQRTAEVLQVYVEPDARELGAGAGLLAAAMHAARAQGCTTIEGSALPGDRHTKNLYERAGITARRIVVSRRLDD